MPEFEFGGEGFPIVREGRTGVIYKNAVNLISATLSVTETLYPGDVVRYYIYVATDAATPPESLDRWDELEVGVSKTFTMTGEDAYLRVVFIGAGGAQTYVEDIQIQFVEAT